MSSISTVTKPGLIEVLHSGRAQHITMCPAQATTCRAANIPGQHKIQAPRLCSSQCYTAGISLAYVLAGMDDLRVITIRPQIAILITST